MWSEAERFPRLMKSLWWYVAIHELRKDLDYQSLNLAELGAHLIESRFVVAPSLVSNLRSPTQAASKSRKQRNFDNYHNGNSVRSGGQMSYKSQSSSQSNQASVRSTSPRSMPEASTTVYGDGTMDLLILKGALLPYVPYLEGAVCMSCVPLCDRPEMGSGCDFPR